MNTNESKTKSINVVRRKNRTRSRLRGTKDMPRISVMPTLSGFSVQFIDDEKGITILSGSDRGLTGSKTEKAKALGAKIAQESKKVGIITGVFDKGSKKYHGRVKAFADALREGGMKL
jgi:large subunit ribosomal protein L18